MTFLPGSPVPDGEVTSRTYTARDLVLRTVPDLGAKICSLQWRGRELVARNPHRPLRRATYGASYADYDASGFDECFPSIGPCPYPDAPYAGVPVPDHGELWSIPWREELTDGAVYQVADGVCFPYRFHRWLDAPGPGHLRFHYRVDNAGPAPLRALWSAHPLLALRPGMRVYLPAGTRVRVDWSRGGRLGTVLDEHPWPVTRDASGAEVDLSLILPPSAGLVDKLYTTALLDGWCALHDPEDGFYVIARFAPRDIPYVGLSINLGGWPVDGPGYYNLGLEPCNGYPDRLDVAAERGACLTLAPGASRAWEWHLFAGQTDDVRAEAARLEERQ